MITNYSPRSSRAGINCARLNGTEKGNLMVVCVLFLRTVEGGRLLLDRELSFLFNLLG